MVADFHVNTEIFSPRESVKYLLVSGYCGLVNSRRQTFLSMPIIDYPTLSVSVIRTHGKNHIVSAERRGVEWPTDPGNCFKFSMIGIHKRQTIGKDKGTHEIRAGCFVIPKYLDTH